MKLTGQHEQVGLEAREEAGEASGLCAEVAEGSGNQDTMRVEAKEVVVGRIQLCDFNQLRRGRAYTSNPGSEFRHLGLTFGRVYSEALSPIQHIVPGKAHQYVEVVQEMSPDDPVADPGRLAAFCLWVSLSP